MKKRWMILLISCLLFLGISFCSVSAAEVMYYVCFQEENYAVKTKNMLLEKEEGFYFLEKITLKRTNSFYIMSTDGERYYAKNNQEMKVDQVDPLEYTIYFSKEYIFDDAHIDATMHKTDAHLTYALYQKESYQLKINDREALELVHNPYQKKYDAFECQNVLLTKEDILCVEKEEEKFEEYTVLATAKYRVIFTPPKIENGDIYAFNEDGEYGTGSEYKYSIYLEEEVDYYLEFCNLTPSKEADVVYEDRKLFKLERDLEHPDAFLYSSIDIFLSLPEQKVMYRLYQKNQDSYELIDDDEDEKVNVSKIKGSYAGWYQCIVSKNLNEFTTSLKQNKQDLNEYYLATYENHYLYDAYGLVEEKEDYRFLLIEEEDEIYNKDYDQYRLLYKVTKEMVNKEVYITNGIDYYRNGTSYIQFKQEGLYEILFSEEHLYGIKQNYQFILLNETTELEQVPIHNLEDFQQFIEQCNQNSYYSLNKRFYLTDSIQLNDNINQIHAFYGEFDGNYHHLIHLNYMTDEAIKNYGFFQYVGKQGKIKNLYIDDLNITAKNASNVGFIGLNYGTLEHVTITGKITGKESVGALVGYNANYALEEDDPIFDSSHTYAYGTLRNIHNFAEVLGEKRIGGIAGFNGGKIYESINEGKINNISYSSKKNIERVGGIAGYSTGVIGLCKNKGIVGYIGVADYVGGIAGLSTGMFFYDSNEAQVLGMSSVGGIIGCYGSLKNEDDSIVEETDLNQHYATYLLNTGDVLGDSRIGGLIGKVSQTGIKLTTSINQGSIEARNGSYCGGAVGDFQYGYIDSIFTTGTAMASGTNGGQYLGGIAGQSFGEINNVFSSMDLVGNDYIGGILGYMSSTGSLKNSVSNVLIAVQNENATNIGYVIGKAEKIPTPEVDFDFLQCNYFVGDIYGGVGNFIFDRKSKDAACRLSWEDMISEDILSPYFLSYFSNGFMGGTSAYSFPYLRAFQFYKEEKEFSFDYDMEKLFLEYGESFVGIEEKYASASILINFFEWDEETGEMDDRSSYQLIKTYRYFYNEDRNQYPVFHFATNEKYSTSKGNYFVEWENIKDEFCNQNIFANYIQIISTIGIENQYLIEGEFKEGTTVKVTCIGNSIDIEFYLNGEKIIVKDFIFKQKKMNGALFYEIQEGEERLLETFIYGDYEGIKITSSENRINFYFDPQEGLPIWSIVLISCGSTLLIGGATLALSYFIKKKKFKRKDIKN